MSTYNREVGIRRSPPALGASGSVNASVIFNILYSPYSTVLIYDILPMPAWALGGLWLAYDISGAMVALFALVHLRELMGVLMHQRCMGPWHPQSTKSFKVEASQCPRKGMQAWTSCLHSLMLDIGAQPCTIYEQSVI